MLRPTVLDVDLSALEHNLRAMRTHAPNSKFLAVLKANAYGHGLVPCARFLEQHGVEYFGVAYLEEGICLRNAGIKAAILVFGGILGSQVQDFLAHDLEMTASSVSKLEAIEDVAAREKKVARVHLKIDTGMERVGIHHYNADRLIEAAVSARHCEVVGVYSHLACSEEADFSFSRLQLERFEECLEFFHQRSLAMPIRHLANSAAFLRDSAMHLDMVRPGLCLYGVYPHPSLVCHLDLQPVLSLKSTVVYFKCVPSGTGISYNHRYTTVADTRLATVAVGYGDGFFRRLGNCGSTLIRGERKPIVGAVCMDQLMVDLGRDGVAYCGDEVVLIGRQGDECITVGEIAELVGTCPHEVLTATNMRVPRRYIYGGEVVSVFAE